MSCWPSRTCRRPESTGLKVGGYSQSGPQLERSSVATRISLSHSRQVPGNGDIHSRIALSPSRPSPTANPVAWVLDDNREHPTGSKVDRKVTTTETALCLPGRCGFLFFAALMHQGRTTHIRIYSRSR